MMITFGIPDVIRRNISNPTKCGELKRTNIRKLTLRDVKAWAEWQEKKSRLRTEQRAREINKYMTNVVNKYLDKYDAYCGRGSIFGNQYVIGVDGDRDEVCDKYQRDFDIRIENDREFREAVLELKDKTLGCFCKGKGGVGGKRCHVDTIANWVNNYYYACNKI